MSNRKVSQYSLDKYVPIPPKTKSGGQIPGGLKDLGLPWRDMVVGDSFFVPFSAWLSVSNPVVAINNSLRNRHKNSRFRYTLRTRRIAKGDGEDGWRIWRIE